MDKLLEKGLLPDFVLRWGIRRLNKKRLQEVDHGSVDANQDRLNKFIEELASMPIAINTQDANEQHYELPPQFFELVLGKHLKYSCGFWDQTTRDLDIAEKTMLDITIQRADLQDSQEILELGCGWGSLTLEMARRFPKSSITAVSNSSPQRMYIEKRLAMAGLNNVRVITCDMNDLELEGPFDRVVSVEMFEHMKNYNLLFGKIHKLLNNSGKLFVHIFSHREFSYHYEVRDQSDWMTRYFFSGGTMPGNNLFAFVCHPLKLKQQWLVSGTHYAKTSEAWLKNMDQNRSVIANIFQDTYGAEYKKWIQYWRIFFLAVAEFFNTNQGREWMVSHYLFEKK